MFPLNSTDGKVSRGGSSSRGLPVPSPRARTDRQGAPAALRPQPRALVVPGHARLTPASGPAPWLGLWAWDRYPHFRANSFCFVSPAHFWSTQLRGAPTSCRTEPFPASEPARDCLPPRFYPHPMCSNRPSDVVIHIWTKEPLCFPSSVSGGPGRGRGDMVPFILGLGFASCLQAVFVTPKK